MYNHLLYSLDKAIGQLTDVSKKVREQSLMALPGDLVKALFSTVADIHTIDALFVIDFLAKDTKLDCQYVIHTGRDHHLFFDWLADELDIQEVRYDDRDLMIKEYKLQYVLDNLHHLEFSPA